MNSIATATPSAINTLWGDLNDFPSLSESKEIKYKKTKIIEKTEEEETQKPLEKTLKEKRLICKSIREGKECSYGNKCQYAHYVDDITPKECSFGDNCYRIKYTKNFVRNVDNKNPCTFIHPEENTEMYFRRHGLNPENMKKPDPSVVFKNTRMCNAILEGIECEGGAECTYAHDFNDLRISPCLFGDECRNICKNEEIYSNESCDKKCYFIHPKETRENYKDRVVLTYKKREAPEPIEEIDTTIVKRHKTDDKIDEKQELLDMIKDLNKRVDILTQRLESLSS